MLSIDVRVNARAQLIRVWLGEEEKTSVCFAADLPDKPSVSGPVRLFCYKLDAGGQVYLLDPTRPREGCAWEELAGTGHWEFAAGTPDAIRKNPRVCAVR